MCLKLKKIQLCIWLVVYMWLVVPSCSLSSHQVALFNECFGQLTPDYSPRECQDQLVWLHSVRSIFFCFLFVVVTAVLRACPVTSMFPTRESGLKKQCIQLLLEDFGHVIHSCPNLSIFLSLFSGFNTTHNWRLKWSNLHYSKLQMLVNLWNIYII